MLYNQPFSYPSTCRNPSYYQVSDNNSPSDFGYRVIRGSFTLVDGIGV